MSFCEHALACDYRQTAQDRTDGDLTQHRTSQSGDNGRHPLYSPGHGALTSVHLQTVHVIFYIGNALCGATALTRPALMGRWLLPMLLLLLQGCSTVKLAYQQLPTLSYWWLDSQLSFSDSQTPKVKEALDNLQRWHRQQELPLYAQLLARSAQIGQDNIQPQDVCALWSEGQARADRLIQEALRQAAPVVATLNARQLNHLARHFELKNEEWEKQWLRGSKEERAKRRLNTTMDRFSDFYGDLSTAQIALLQSQMARSEWTPEWGMQQRKRQQQDLLRALQKIQQQSLPSTALEVELYGVWQRWTQPPQSADAALALRLRLQACQSLADFHNGTSAEQRQRVARRLRAYERDLRDLITP